jgi:hypothetical protein
MTWQDPIVEEIHAIRQAYAARFNPLQGAIPRSLLRSRSDAFSF